MARVGESADSARDALAGLSSINELADRDRRTPENIQTRREYIAQIMHGLVGRDIVFDPHKDQPEQRIYQIPDATNKPKEAEQVRRRLEVTIAKVAVAGEPEVVSETRGMFVAWGELMAQVLRPDSADEDYARRIIEEDKAVLIDGGLVRYADGTAKLHGDLLRGASEVVSARILVSNADNIHAVRDSYNMRQDSVIV